MISPKINPVAEFRAKTEKLIPKETTTNVAAQAIPHHTNACDVLAMNKNRMMKKVKESCLSNGIIGQVIVPNSPNAKNIHGIVLNPKVGPPVSRWGPR